MCARMCMCVGGWGWVGEGLGYEYKCIGGQEGRGTGKAAA